MQDALRKMAEARRKAAEEERRFMMLAESDPFNPEVQVGGAGQSVGHGRCVAESRLLMALAESGPLQPQKCGWVGQDII